MFDLLIYSPYKLESTNEADIKILKFIEAFNHMKKLKGKRFDFPALKSLNGDLTPFIENLPFKLTREQLSVIDEVKRDLANYDRATKRLVIGDVGSGKTMIILAGATIAPPQIGQF